MPYDRGVCNISIITLLYTVTMILPSVLGVLCVAILPLRAEMLAVAHAPLASLMGSQIQLLIENRFRIQPNGSVIDPTTSKPVPSDELPFLLQSLEGRKRLQVLLQLDLILNKSEGEKHLTFEERESMRAILHANWSLFNLETRKNFRRYFSLEELESLDLIPLPKARLPEPELRDREAAPIATPPAPAVVVQPAPVPDAPVVQPTPMAAVPVAPAAVIPSVVVAPPIPPITIVAQPAPIPAAPAAAITPAVVVPPAPAVAVVAQPAPLVIAPPPPPAAPVRSLAMRTISNEEFELFLKDAPYNKDVKALLRLIAAKAPFARLRVINDLMFAIPQITLDSERCGLQAYSRLVMDSPEKISITLNQGVFVHHKRVLFFNGVATILPLSAKAPEGSQKVLYSTEQQAGSLLAELLRLDSRLRGWDSSPYAVESAARAAQALFYDVVAREAGNDSFLQGEMKSSYRLWRDWPIEYRDWLVDSLAAAHGEAMSRMDPKGQSVVAESVEAERRIRQERQPHALQD